jgi:predicted hydrocarbon binding protein
MKKMNKEELRKVIGELGKSEGEVRGEKFRTHASYIKEKQGVKGLLALEKELENLGISLKLEDSKSLSWYPAFLHPAILLVAQNLFDWDDKEIFEMGRSAARVSFIGRVLIKYFVSLDKFLNEIAPGYWQKYYNFGELKVSQTENQDKFIVEIKDYDLHPIACVYNSGYFSVVTSYLIKKKGVFSVKETKCVHKGDSCHQFIIEWQQDNKKNETEHSDQETQELINKLKDRQGKTRGVAIITTVAYIQKMKGENGINLVEKELEKLGYPLDLRQIDKSQWYHCLIDPLIMVIAKNAFGWQDKDFYDAGYFAPQVSPIAKIFLRYFISIDKAFQGASKYWKRYYSFGKLEAVEMDKEKKYFVLRLKDYDLSPLLCVYHKGYFVRTACFTLGKEKNISIEEPKCIHRGDSYHEYRITWE